MSSSASRRVLKNFGVVLGGRGIAAVLNLAATALMAHALPPVEFGLVILLHTYVLAIRGILNFRTFEAIVKFGVPLHAGDDREGLITLFRQTSIIDTASALAATALAVLAVPVAGALLHWDERMVSLAAVYSLVMLTMVSNTPNGVLRLYDRFDALSVFYTVGPLIRLIGVVIAWSTHAQMHVFIAVWATAFVLENTWLIVRGHLELRRHLQRHLWQGGNWRHVMKTTVDFRHFIAMIYWQTNVDLLPKHLSVLLAGNLLGPASAGIFRLARDFSAVLTKPAMMLREVLFPDLTRIHHSAGEGFHQLGYNAVKTAGAIGLLLVIVSIPTAGPILGLIGPEYRQGATLLSLMLLAATFELATAPLRAAAYATGRVASVLRIHVLGILVFLGMFYLLTPRLGLPGPGIAAVTGALLTLVLMFGVTRQQDTGNFGA
jgi:O-antigen/teichoic acid export membrane protein